MRTLSYIPAAILRAVDRVGALQARGVALVVEEIQSRDWASATFAGETHRFALRLEGVGDAVAAAAAALAASIGESDIPMAGHFVAEIAVELGDICPDGPNRIVQTLALSALTIAD